MLPAFFIHTGRSFMSGDRAWSEPACGPVCCSRNTVQSVVCKINCNIKGQVLMEPVLMITAQMPWHRSAAGFFPSVSQIMANDVLLPTPALSGSGSMVSELVYSVSAGMTQPPSLIHFPLFHAIRSVHPADCRGGYPRAAGQSGLYTFLGVKSTVTVFRR